MARHMLFAIALVASFVALRMYGKQFNQTYHYLSTTVIEYAWDEHTGSHTATTIVANTNQPIVLCDADSEISVIMVWLQVVGKAYWWPSMRGTIWPFLNPHLKNGFNQ